MHLIGRLGPSWALRLSMILLALSALSCAAPKSPPPAAEAPATPQAEKLPAGALPDERIVVGKPESIMANPEPDKAVNIEFILDASGSMLEKAGERSRAEIAKEVISRLAGEIPPNIKLGLRVYGHRYPESDKARSCEDIQLLSPLGSGDAGRMAEQLKGVQPRGWTAMGRSLEQAGEEMAAHLTNINNIVLLSDGKETCDGKPVEVAQRLKEGPARITVHTIGFAIDEDARKELEEMASVSGGSYNEAQDAQGLLDAVGKALVAARSGTFLRAEVSGEAGRQVGLSVWLIDPKSGKKVHELRSWIDSPIAPGVYDILVGTAPRVGYRGLEIKEHTRTAIRLAVGGIRLELVDAGGQFVKVMAHLVDRESGAVLRDFSTWYNQPVLPGSYDVRIDSNPPLLRRNVQVTERDLSIVGLRNGSLRVNALGLGGVKPNWEIELRDSQSGEAVYKSMVGREQTVMSGDYQLVVFSHPQISMPVKIGPAEVKTVSLQTGLLRIEALDNQGRRANYPVTLEDSSGKESGRLNTWEDATPLPGSYQMVIHSQPELRQGIQVSPSQPTILKLRTS